MQLPSEFEPIERVYKKFRQTRKRIPGKAILIAAHTSEHPAVLPFQKALATKLRSEGIITEEHKIDDTMERALNIRKRLLKDAMPKMIELSSEQWGMEVLGDLLCLMDSLIRMRLLSTLVIKAGNDIFGLELHSSIDDGAFDIPATDDEYSAFRILRGNNTIVDINFARSCLSKMVFLYHSGSERLSSGKEIAGLAGLNLDEMLMESRELIQTVMNGQRRITAIEIPSRRLSLEGGSEMHEYYTHDSGLIKISGWEKMYCSHKHQSIGFTEKDIIQVSSILKL